MPWRYVLTALLVVAALAGLAVMQYYLLYTRLTVEKLRFDQEMRAVVNQSRLAVQDDAVLTSLLTDLYTGQTVAEDRLRQRLRDHLTAALDTVEVMPTFYFALYDLSPPRNLILADTGYVARTGTLGRYRKGLPVSIAAACACRPELEIQVQAVVPYLLRRLGNLIIPSVLSLLLLLVSLLLFVRWLGKLRRLNQRQNDFINHLTHELKTPIFSSRLLLRLLSEANEKGDQTAIRRYTQLLRGENTRLETQTARILELATQENRTDTLREPTDLHALIREEAATFAERIQDRNGHLVLTLADKPLQLSLDAAAWRDVVRNLLDNALKYQDDPPEIAIHSIVQGKRVVLRFADRGHGIARKYRRQVFRKFYRAPGQSVSGYGLGLTNVRRIVRQHGGRIGAMPREGGGTVFTITLPLNT